MSVLLDTDAFPAADRLDAVQAAYETQSPRRLVVAGSSPLRHRVERVSLGPDAHLLHTGGSPLQVVRTARHVREDAPEHVAIGLHRRGRTTVCAADADAEVPDGHLTCVDMTAPYRVVHRSEHSHDVLVVRNADLGLSVDVVRAARDGLSHSPLYPLVRGHLAGLYRAAVHLPPESRALTGQATSALVRALLTSAAGAPARAEALESSLAVRLVVYLDLHLPERDLTVERVAAAHHVSVRHVYNVWARAGHDVPIGRWILDRRLQRARDLLADPASGLSVALVAQRCGFADVSHFIRRFRESSGVTPGEWRRSHVTDPRVPSAQ